MWENLGRISTVAIGQEKKFRDDGICIMENSLTGISNKGSYEPNSVALGLVLSTFGNFT
jgi:hypothetical protein